MMSTMDSAIKIGRHSGKIYRHMNLTNSYLHIPNLTYHYRHLFRSTKYTYRCDHLIPNRTFMSERNLRDTYHPDIHYVHKYT